MRKTRLSALSIIFFPVPCSLFPVPCSLFPVPYSLFSTTTTKSNHYKWGMIVDGDNYK
ncbi:MAG: hypothetical protein F6K65_29915 [Moorea sp. SIO3C2]|nr:hypothetical protein [Moorena sp. SIO3C2]